MERGKSDNAPVSAEQRDKMIKIAAVGGAIIVLAILGYFLAAGMPFVKAFTNVAPLVMVFVVLLVVLRKSPSMQLRWAAYAAGVVFFGGVHSCLRHGSVTAMADNEKWWVKYGTIAAIALLPCGALSAELPPALKGVWTKQVSAATTNPNRVVLGGDAATIDGERCKLDSLRAIHSARWYADFTCSSTNRLWVDVSVLAEDRIMMNRRPLAEADIYVRGGSK